MSNTNLVSLHILIDKDDMALINAFSPNHGDRSKLVKTIIHNYCKELRKGKSFILPPEVQSQLTKLSDKDK